MVDVGAICNELEEASIRLTTTKREGVLVESCLHSQDIVPFMAKGLGEGVERE